MTGADFLDEIAEKEPERTPFLSVLCILTWIGSWFLSAYCIIWMFRNNEVEDTQFYYFKYPMEYNLIKAGLFAALLSAVGAYFIWNLKRFGFFIYLGGQVLLGVFGLFVHLLVLPLTPPETYVYIVVFIGQLGFVGLYAMHWNIINSKR